MSLTQHDISFADPVLCPAGRKHLLSINDLSDDELQRTVKRSTEFAQGLAVPDRRLRRKAVGLYFQKTSTRTRTSFTLAAAHLGARMISYGPADLQINTGESIEDTARVLSECLDALVIRSCGPMSELQTWAAQDNMAVINAMSELEHPTQAIADLATITEHFGALSGLEVLYLGEGNNTAVALALALSRSSGTSFTVLTPADYGLPEEIVMAAQRSAKLHGARFREEHDMNRAPVGVDVVYTTRWQTTGTTKPIPTWRDAFEPFRVTNRFMAHVSKSTSTVFMHDLPAVRGDEVDSEVLDGPQSIAFRQAKYKLFSAIAILERSLL